MTRFLRALCCALFLVAQLGGTVHAVPPTATPSASPGSLTAVLLAGGRGPVISAGSGNATFYDLIKPIVLPPGTLRPGAMLDLAILFDFISSNAGRSVQVTLNNVLVGQSYPTAAVFSLNSRLQFWPANDLSGLIVYSQNLNDALSPAVVSASPFGTRASVGTLVAVDVSGTVTIRVQAKPVNNDQVRIAGISLTQSRTLAGPAALVPNNAIQAWGDSLTAGTGATAAIATAGGWPTQLRVAQPGRPVTNYGIGGQTSQQIVDRMVADKVAGRGPIIVAWLCRNDVGVAANLTTTCLAQHARAVANLAPGAVYLPATIIPASTETTGSGNHNAILAANAAIKAAYPNAIDLFAALATEPDGTVAAANRFDSIHLNDTGYGIVKDTVAAKLTALGL